MQWLMRSVSSFGCSLRGRHCRLLFNLLQVILLLWLENADGHINLHADAGQADYRESQLPGFVKVTMSHD